MAESTHKLLSQLSLIRGECDEDWKARVLICIDFAKSAEKRKDFDEAVSLAKHYLNHVVDDCLRDEICCKIFGVIDQRVVRVLGHSEFGTSLGIKLKSVG